MDVDNINIITKIIFLSLWVFRNLYLPLRHVECAPQIFDLLVEALCSLVNWKPRKFSIEQTRKAWRFCAYIAWAVISILFVRVFLGPPIKAWHISSTLLYCKCSLGVGGHNDFYNEKTFMDDGFDRIDVCELYCLQ